MSKWTARIAITAAVVAMILALSALFYSVNAHANPCRGCVDPRPNKVAVQTPSHAYGFVCGHKQIIGTHTFVFSNCRRRA